ncbi:molybdenum cofactor guanylyltransferase [Robertkochia aurantiaca]|uniref:molybdenum cofactor guanylyltransferase n=1 Tax=Robertkochia aurantiaca TaxID=2873700 RepID=UPI001CCB9767|nr:NTP transferase domain-containing protein [Robertkochia sp. 3YJGBD-33]
MTLRNKGVYGLVLSGGKSSRMGRDKSKIAYHGQPQEEYLFGLLDRFCDHTFISVRSSSEKDERYITDDQPYRGPLNGMLSAHKRFPEVAWFVLACDLPLADERSVKELLQARDRSFFATSYALKGSELPEPLFAIWEAEAFSEAEAYLLKGEKSCPRKFLLNNNTHIIHPYSDKVLMNANSEEEYQKAMEIIGHR